MIQLYHILETTSPYSWPEKLLQQDPSGKQLLKVYTILSSNEFGKREMTLIQRFRETILQGASSEHASLRTRHDHALEQLIVRRLSKSATMILPASVWGKIGRELFKVCSVSACYLSMTCKALYGETYWDEAIKDVAILDVRKAIRQKKPLIPRSFYNGKIDSLIPAMFRQLHVLYLHSIHELPVNATIFERLARTFTKIRYLNLFCSRLSENHFRKLQSFKELQVIDLTACSFEPEHLAFLAPTLQSVVLSSNKRGDQLVQHLGHLRQLEELDLSNTTDLSVQGLTALGSFPSLKKLHVQRCFLSSDVMQALPRTLCKLTCDQEVSQAAKTTLPSCDVEKYTPPSCSIM